MLSLHMYYYFFAKTHACAKLDTFEVLWMVLYATNSELIYIPFLFTSYLSHSLFGSLYGGLGCLMRLTLSVLKIPRCITQGRFVIHKLTMSATMCQSNMLEGCRYGLCKRSLITWHTRYYRFMRYIIKWLDLRIKLGCL